MSELDDFYCYCSMTVSYCAGCRSAVDPDESFIRRGRKVFHDLDCYNEYLDRKQVKTFDRDGLDSDDIWIRLR